MKIKKPTIAELENFINFFNDCVSIGNELMLNDNKISLYSRYGTNEITCNFAIKGSIKNATELKYNLSNKKYFFKINKSKTNSIWFNILIINTNICFSIYILA